MIYRFQSRATGDVLMTDEGGEQVLRAMGLAPSPRGVIEPGDMPAAIEAIEAAIGHEDAASDLARSVDVAQGADSTEQAPTLRQRARPFIDMLKRAHAEGKAVVWGV